MSVTTYSKHRRKSPRAKTASWFPPRDLRSVTTIPPGGGSPHRRGILVADEESPQGHIGRFVRAAFVAILFLALVADQAYRPDLSRQREVLMTQIAEAAARVDRTRKELDHTMEDRDRIARDGVPADQRSRWTGEPYQSTEHCLHDYDRRIGHLQVALEQVVAQAEGYSADLQVIDAGGGRRVPFANQLLARLRKEVAP